DHQEVRQCESIRSPGLSGCSCRQGAAVGRALLGGAGGAFVGRAPGVRLEVVRLDNQQPMRLSHPRGKAVVRS
ncbi:MAG: hypothetical protein ABSH34_31885, partial [Verrucomicrobiota bacterium]